MIWIDCCSELQFRDWEFETKLLEFNKNIIFQIDLFIAISHVKFLATTFDDNVNKTRREKFIDAIVYWAFHCTMWICSKMIKSFICCIVVKVNFREINILFEKQYRIFCIVSNAVLLYTLSIHVVETSTIQCILIDFSLILSNVNFLSHFWFWFVLHSWCFAIACFCCNHHSINFQKRYNILIFDALSWKCQL